MPWTRDQITIATDMDNMSTLPPYFFHVSKLGLYSDLTLGKDLTFNFPARRSCSHNAEQGAEGTG